MFSQRFIHICIVLLMCYWHRLCLCEKQSLISGLIRTFPCYVHPLALSSYNGRFPLLSYCFQRGYGERMSLWLSVPHTETLRFTPIFVNDYFLFSYGQKRTAIDGFKFTCLRELCLHLVWPCLWLSRTWTSSSCQPCLLPTSVLHFITPMKGSRNQPPVPMTRTPNLQRTFCLSNILFCLKSVFRECICSTVRNLQRCLAKDKAEQTIHPVSVLKHVTKQ